MRYANRLANSFADAGNATCNKKVITVTNNSKKNFPDDYRLSLLSGQKIKKRVDFYLKIEYYFPDHSKWFRLNFNLYSSLFSPSIHKHEWLF